MQEGSSSHGAWTDAVEQEDAREEEEEVEEPPVIEVDGKVVEGNPFEAMHFPPARKFGSGIYRADGGGAKRKGSKDQWAPRLLLNSVRLDEARAGRLEAPKEDEVVGKLLFNFRDLAEATTGRSRLRIKPGRVYRTACIARGDVDVDQIAEIIAFLKDRAGIRTIIDFRNKDEKQADPFDRVLEEFYPTTKLQQQTTTSTATGPNLSDGKPQRQRFHIPIMNTDFKLKGLFNLGTNKMTKLYVHLSLVCRRFNLSF
jgi:hypothetical protein